MPGRPRPSPLPLVRTGVPFRVGVEVGSAKVEGCGISSAVGVDADSVVLLTDVVGFVGLTKDLGEETSGVGLF